MRRGRLTEALLRQTYMGEVASYSLFLHPCRPWFCGGIRGGDTGHLGPRKGRHRKLLPSTHSLGTLQGAGARKAGDGI